MRAAPTAGWGVADLYGSQRPECRREKREREPSSAEETLSKTGIPLRESFRNHGAFLRQSHPHGISMPLQPENFVVLIPSFTTGGREDCRLDLAAQILNSGGVIRMQVSGASMLPSIWPGDTLVIESKMGAKIVSGDIVLIARDGRFFVHRLVGRLNSQWITRGDSMPQPDPPATTADLLGRVSAIHRGRQVVNPRRRVAFWASALAWMLCNWDAFRNLTLRAHLFWYNHSPTYLGRVSAANRVDA